MCSSYGGGLVWIKFASMYQRYAALFVCWLRLESADGLLCMLSKGVGAAGCYSYGVWHTVFRMHSLGVCFELLCWWLFQGVYRCLICLYAESSQDCRAVGCAKCT
ncbi:hypothetical protein LOK49_LG09G02850 [Camellia lanceoleosa]|uniref:Uncharacterized protein n=1 Tax=Camellia lanceoleosa TaxID=1840588 RepID=A0ACC0GL37_9ERIC|nr:hypothetical protein LOK49_LG09G02850 [Camellia lanceoleosa]